VDGTHGTGLSTKDALEQAQLAKEATRIRNSRRAESGAKPPSRIWQGGACKVQISLTVRESRGDAGMRGFIATGKKNLGAGLGLPASDECQGMATYAMRGGTTRGLVDSAVAWSRVCVVFFSVAEVAF
jgi:hypothetical protein